MLKRNIFVLVIASLFLFACGSDSGKSDVTAIDTTSANNNSKELANAQQILYTLPSPVEAAALMKMSGATFDKTHLNPVSNVSKYVSNDSKALNLGIYGTDLIYSSIFEQTQESAEYFKCANTLSTSLGISEAFGEATFKRLKTNINNRDSLLTIVAEASLDADSYFKENERPAASAMVAAGGWIEGLYIATRIANVTKHQEIIQRVAEQKNSIGNLISLVESFGSEQGLTSVLNDLKEIKAQFDVLEVKKEPADKVDPSSPVPTIGVKKKITMSAEQLKAISDKVEIIRNKIIQ
ncbi:MAG: hypothetical protein JNL63_01930 [Bacteroidia bacterium]|nr:hypothetical protein [Bacteroidia bacterium]